MANILFGAGVADARGSIGGVTFSRGKGGAIIRNRTKPCNPRSSRQNLLRASLGTLAGFWSKELNAGQRADWTAYSEGTNWTNKLGQPIQIGGLAAFVRLGALTLQASMGINGAAPTAMGHAGGPTITFTANSTNKQIVITAAAGAFSPTNVGDVLLIYQAPPVQVGRTMVPTGFRYLGKVVGAAQTPIPQTFSGLWTLAAGQRCWLKVIFIDEALRVAADLFQDVIAAPL